MPACAGESLTKLWPPRGGDSSIGSSGPREIARAGGSGASSLQSASPPSNYSPTSTSPVSMSPTSTSPILKLKSQRSLPNIVASSPTSSPRHSSNHVTFNLSRSPSPIFAEEPEPSFLAHIIGWYPAFLLRFVRSLIATVIYLAWSQFILLGPTLWFSAWLWIFWKTIQLPLTIIKWMLTILHTPALERGRKKRTVLISGGSTIQALHLARNFYSAGARVVVCEVEGLFGLARFSTAVHKFYTVPKPTTEHPQDYVKALCDIVAREEVSYYIPVSATTTAYYDALAKPHVELLGCICFCPGVKEIWALDDILEVFRQCQGVDIPTPIYYPASSRDDVSRLYRSGLLRTGRHFMVSVGASGCRDKLKVTVPPFKQDFKLQHEMSEQKPWVIVQDLPGEHFLTCTTVKDSHVVANVTCRVDKCNGGLVPVESEDIETWLKNFFSKVKFQRAVNGHLSFRLVVSRASGTLVPLGCRVGVAMPYICYTSVHPRIVWKPCRHFSRQASGPLVADSGRYWMHEAVLNTLRHPSVEAVGRLIGTVLDKREALFVYWDPLPYCAYYHLQLPFNNILAFVNGQYGHNGRKGIHRTLAAPAR